MFNLVVEEFQMREQVNGTMPVIVSKHSGIFLASPISLILSPLTIDEASNISGEGFNEAGELGVLANS